MSKDDFKNAAAKLLAQHAYTVKKADGSLPAAINNEADSKPVVSSVLIPQRETPVNLPEPKDTDYSFCEPQRDNWFKRGSLVGLALLGCAVMVFLIPETIFGLIGNAIIGIVSGVGLGWIINREPS